MFPITSRVTCVRAGPGVYRLYYQSRDAARWLEAIEDAAAAPLAAA
jgi:hypothetical protein